MHKYSAKIQIYFVKNLSKYLYLIDVLFFFFLSLYVYQEWHSDYSMPHLFPFVIDWSPSKCTCVYVCEWDQVCQNEIWQAVHSNHDSEIWIIKTKILITLLVLCLDWKNRGHKLAEDLKVFRIEKINFFHHPLNLFKIWLMNCKFEFHEMENSKSDILISFPKSIATDSYIHTLPSQWQSNFNYIVQ